MTLGPRNVSHRVSPALLPDGRVVYTEWRHMGMVNDGHLRMMNTDMTGMREAFGGEQGGNGGTNSYLKARYVADQDRWPTAATADYQMVAIAHLARPHAAGRQAVPHRPERQRGALARPPT